MYRRLRGVALAVVMAVLLSACQASVRVGVEENKSGSGRVTVTVTLDRSATEAVGNLARTLETADLSKAGWVVSKPRTGPDGSTVMEASQAFRNPTEAGQLLAQIAGKTPSASVFGGLHLSRTNGFFASKTRLTGTVDLRCRLECFDDPQLETALGGHTLTQEASILQRDNGINLQQAFSFQVVASLPGTITSTNATSRQGRVLGWSPRFGASQVVLVSTRTYNSTHIIIAAVGGGIVVIVVLVVLILLIRRLRRRWRSRRRGYRPSHRRGSGGEERPTAAVSPPPP